MAGHAAEIRPAGDHALVLVGVEHVSLAENCPMVYWHSVFGTHAAQPAAHPDADAIRG